MQSSAYRLPNGVLEKSAIALFVLGVVAVVALVGYYRWERQSQANQPFMERMTQQFEEEVRADPSNVANRLRVANAYVQTRLYDQAIEQYRQVLALEPDNISALVGAGTAYVLKGDNSQAVEHLVRVVELTEGQQFAHLDQRVFSANYYLGKIYLENDQLEEAAQRLRSAEASQPTNADVLNLLALTSQKQGNHSEAIDHFKSALGFDPAFADAYRGLAASYKALGDGDRVAYAEAMAVLFSGNPDGAVSRLEAIPATSRDADVYWGLGWAYEKKGQQERAIMAYQNALDIDRKHGMALTGLRRLTGGTR